ncbi:MAG: hypothetical protein AAGJ31_16345, partial [Verrucomicrobiota bacterium]
MLVQDVAQWRASRYSFLLVSVLGLAMSSCVTFDWENHEPAPAQTFFVKERVLIPKTERSYPVWRTKSPGPPVLLLHPVNGLHPDFLRFALLVERWGYRVYLPSLYGESVGRVPVFGANEQAKAITEVLRSPMWHPFSKESIGPIVDDIAVMSRWVSAREGGEKIAVVGNSFTGTIPLAVLDEPSVRLAVLGQPSTPVMRMWQIFFHIPQREATARSLGVSEGKWRSVTQALEQDPRKRIIGFHYWGDPVAPILRFDALHDRLEQRRLDDRFRAFVLTPSS